MSLKIVQNEFKKNISKKYTYIFNEAFNFIRRGQSVCQIE